MQDIQFSQFMQDIQFSQFMQFKHVESYNSINFY